MRALEILCLLALSDAVILDATPKGKDDDEWSITRNSKWLVCKTMGYWRCYCESGREAKYKSMGGNFDPGSQYNSPNIGCNPAQMAEWKAEHASEMKWRNEQRQRESQRASDALANSGSTVSSMDWSSSAMGKKAPVLTPPVIGSGSTVSSMDWSSSQKAPVLTPPDIGSGSTVSSMDWSSSATGKKTPVLTPPVVTKGGTADVGPPVDTVQLDLERQRQGIKDLLNSPTATKKQLQAALELVDEWDLKYPDAKPLGDTHDARDAREALAAMMITEQSQPEKAGGREKETTVPWYRAVLIEPTQDLKAEVARLVQKLRAADTIDDLINAIAAANNVPLVPKEEVSSAEVRLDQKLQERASTAAHVPDSATMDEQNGEIDRREARQPDLPAGISMSCVEDSHYWTYGAPLIIDGACYGLTNMHNFLGGSEATHQRYGRHLKRCKVIQPESSRSPDWGYLPDSHKEVGDFNPGDASIVRLDSSYPDAAIFKLRASERLNGLMGPNNMRLSIGGYLTLEQLKAAKVKQATVWLSGKFGWCGIPDALEAVADQISSKYDESPDDHNKNPIWQKPPNDFNVEPHYVTHNYQTKTPDRSPAHPSTCPPEYIEDLIKGCKAVSEQQRWGQGDYDASGNQISSLRGCFVGAGWSGSVTWIKGGDVGDPGLDADKFYAAALFNSGLDMMLTIESVVRELQSKGRDVKVESCNV